jgi:glutathione synthase/RimK-type ligase-like ATP-grasp enzyme
MKCSLIYFDANQLEDYLFNQTYREAYDDIITEVPIFIWTGRVENGHYIVVDEYCEESRILQFDVSIILVRGKNMPYEKVIYGTTIINSKNALELFDDKLKCRVLIPKISRIKQYLNIRSLKEGFKYVIKPRDGLKGDGILISSNIEELEKHYNMLNSEKKGNVIIEDFMEAQPVLNHKVYDIRVIIAMGNICEVAFRTPAKGSELCNVALGGNIQILKDIDELDLDENLNEIVLSQIWNIRTRVDNNIGSKMSIYSIDFTIDVNDNVKVFEFNSYPGIRKEYVKYTKVLKDTLSLVNNRRKRRKF